MLEVRRSVTLSLKLLRPLVDREHPSVYLAEHFLLDTVCVLKRLRHRSPLPLIAERLQWLQHPHVCRVMEFGDDGEAFCLVMKLVEGSTLHSLLQRHGRLPLHRAVTLIRQLCDGLHAMHSMGLCHADPKPSNVVVGHLSGMGECVTLIDFGITTLLASEVDEIHPKEAVPIPGTPAYMAPERFHNTGSVASDLYAAGVVLYRLLTGELPFRASTVDEYRMQHEQAPLPLERLRERCPSVTPAVVDILQAALAKQPENRFVSAAEMRDALRLDFAPALVLPEWSE